MHLEDRVLRGGTELGSAPEHQCVAQKPKRNEGLKSQRDSGLFSAKEEPEDTPLPQPLCQEPQENGDGLERALLSTHSRSVSASH